MRLGRGCAPSFASGLSFRLRTCQLEARNAEDGLHRIAVTVSGSRGRGRGRALLSSRPS